MIQRRGALLRDLVLLCLGWQSPLGDAPLNYPFALLRRPMLPVPLASRARRLASALSAKKKMAKP